MISCLRTHYFSYLLLLTVSSVRSTGNSVSVSRSCIFHIFYNSFSDENVGGLQFPSPEKNDAMNVLIYIYIYFFFRQILVIGELEILDLPNFKNYFQSSLYDG